ncbi:MULTISPECIES: Cys-tRNA(Pro) deacylase [unclassified Aureispira]|uniref:Cys-tRNA(Pro) deacylase n=1 Tax=unclassified Aureispira TaxID=2649989 RepID=UPI000698934E|nr:MULTISPECIES: Cys-tRNA(Pro) deacylase [unclassified Aureispira]WMX12066.1 Cys-tRNA(Pro) deacylase [Aureispira sp. CCB-E]
MKKTNAIRLLQQKKVTFDTIEYTYDSENLNVQKIAEDNGLTLTHIYKTLVLKGDKTGVFVALVAGDASLSLKKMAAVSQNKKVAMLAVKDLQKHTGYVRGGCSPIGMKKQYSVYISEEAKDLEKLYINAGTRGLLVGLVPKDLYNLAQAEWVEIV